MSSREAIVDDRSGDDAGPVRARLIEPLTPRELQILGLVCDGWSNQQICERLGVCPPTVKFHLLNLFRKLRVRRRTQAVAVAIHMGLVTPDWLYGTDAAPGQRARSGRVTRSPDLRMAS